MRNYKANGGWQIQCQNGPLGGQHLRAYNQIKENGNWVDAPFDWEFRVQGHTDGRYILKPLTAANGSRKQSKHKGIFHDAFYYDWEPDVLDRTDQT